MDLASQLVDRQVGDFRLLDLLGEGGMGAAFRAEQLTLKREAVIKVISTPEVSEELKLRFLREARLASHFDHPYAAHVYAFGAEDDGLLWIAMELVRGIPLDRLIADQGPMPLARFVPFFGRLCEVVYTAHEQGIIHRDIKPSNIMVVRRAGRMLPKLLDFGIARTTLDVEEAPTGELVDAPTEGNRSITLHGRMIGSPEYMAPEMWVNATRATPRSDLYALAITAYEMLTGRRPFTGPTVLAIARAHAKNPAPKLGPGFPSGLDHVFARALAKREAERYANVLELDTAVRELARETAKGTPADLDEVVRDAFIQGGPQPLAEAMLELAAARDPAGAWEAGWRVVQVVLRAVTMIALAARGRVGERGLGAAGTQIKNLVQRGFDVEEWVGLVGSLVEPFADQAQAHPVPDLVTAYRPDGDARRALADLLAMRRDSVDVIDGDRVGELVVQLGKLLRSSAFLTDYTWVHDGALWMGPRRNPRDRRDAPAGIWLVDRDGVAILELSPLVSVAPPAPGADDELFLLDGPAKRGARSVAWPREFERYDEKLLDFVAGLAPLGAAGAIEAQDVAPYRGLAAFGPGDAAMFFGREREVEAVVNRLRVQPLIAVVGPSGVGKSSFVHAGVMPALPDTWQTLSLRPGASPLASVEARLISAGIATPGFADRLRDDPALLGRVLDEAAHRQGERIVIVIDQLEETFTQCRDTAVRDQFARALDAIGGSVNLVFTLRDDFLVRTAELPGLGSKLQTSLELVTLPDPTALRRILVEPLARVGYKFETDDLPDDMVAAVREHPGALALLSFAAAKLWDLRDRTFRHIPQRAYDSIGGVVGALARHAEDTLSSLPDTDHALVRELFRHLVTSEGTRATLYRDEAIQLLGKTAAAERVIETLVDRRLLTAYEGESKIERIEVVHEALLSAWPRLVTWQREDAESARMRDQVRSAARQWGERGRPKGLLWRGEALLELKLWQARQGGGLTDLERDFAAASVADETRTRRVRRLALATVIAGLAIGLVVLQQANKKAERNAEASRRAALAMLVEQGRAALVAHKPQEAMVYLSTAYTRGADEPTLPFMLGLGRSQLGGESLVLVHPVGVKWADLTADGRHVATAALDGVVRVWDAKTGALEHELTGTGPMLMIRPSLIANGGLLTWSFMGELPTVWDVATGAKRFELPAPAALAAPAAGGTIIVTLEPARVRAWRAADGGLIGEQAVAAGDQSMLNVDGERYAVDVAGGAMVGPIDMSAPPHLVPDADFGYFGGRGTRVLKARKRRLLEYDVDRPGPPKTLPSRTGEYMKALEFSPDGGRALAMMGSEHTAKIWDPTGDVISLDGHDGVVFALGWSPDGTLAVTGSADRTVRVWDTGSGVQRALFYGHTDLVTDVRFDRSGERVVSASYDGTVRIFDARHSVQAVDVARDGPLSLRLSVDDRRLLSVGHDGGAWVHDLATRNLILAVKPLEQVPHPFDWDPKRGCGDLDATGERVVVPAGTEARVYRIGDGDRPVAVLGPHPGRVTCARFAGDGRTITTTIDGHVLFWSAAGTLERDLTVHDGRINAIELDPRSARVLTAAQDGTAILIGPGDARRVIAKTESATAIEVAVFSHDGTQIATSNGTTTSVIDEATGEVRWASHGVSDVMAIAFSPDDLVVASTTSEGTINLYNAADGRLLTVLGDAKIGAWVYGGVYGNRSEIVLTSDRYGRIREYPLVVETRSAADVASEVACRVPLEMVGTRLVAHPVARCAAP